MCSSTLLILTELTLQGGTYRLHHTPHPTPAPLPPLPPLSLSTSPLLLIAAYPHRSCAYPRLYSSTLFTFPLRLHRPVFTYTTTVSASFRADLLRILRKVRLIINSLCVLVIIGMFRLIVCYADVNTYESASIYLKKSPLSHLSASRLLTIGSLPFLRASPQPRGAALPNIPPECSHFRGLLLYTLIHPPTCSNPFCP